MKANTLKNTCVCVLLFLAFSVFLIANPRLSCADEKKIIVGVQDIEEYLPESQYKNNEYTGFSKQLLDMFAKKYGYTFIYQAYPLKRLYAQFLNGELDLKYPDNEYWSKAEKKGKRVIYSKPVVKYVDGVMVLPKNKGKGIGSLKTLGTMLGYTPFSYLKLINEGKLMLHENINFHGLLKQAVTERNDGAYSNIAVSRHYMKLYYEGKDVLVFDSSLPYTKSTRHLSTINHPEIIEEFNRFLIDEKVKINKLKNQYKIEETIDDIK